MAAPFCKHKKEKKDKEMFLPSPPSHTKKTPTSQIISKSTASYMTITYQCHSKCHDNHLVSCAPSFHNLPKEKSLPMPNLLDRARWTRRTSCCAAKAGIKNFSRPPCARSTEKNRKETDKKAHPQRKKVGLAVRIIRIRVAASKPSPRPSPRPWAPHP